MKRTRIADRSGVRELPASAVLDPGTLLAGDGPLELEIGFGKGRYLLRRAAEDPGRRFCGIEIANEYFRLAARRLVHRRLDNLLLLEGDAAYFATALLPPGRFAAVHVYFPDPWPKLRHQKRRLFSPEAIDLVAGLVAPGGRFWFATDFLEYGAGVRRILEGYPGARVVELEGGWPDGARTNYEAKYVAEGRPIVRLEVAFDAPAALHPDGAVKILVAARPTAG
ncbi:MAG: tRNA (guanosine(46)-N(7))-methyltransferase TrmB [Thermoanaerobaculia bacterium]